MAGMFSRHLLRNGIASVCAFIIMCGAWAGSAPTRYFENSLYGFSVELPANWSQVPEDAVRSLIELTGKKHIVAVFRAPGSPDWYANPSVVIEYYPKVARNISSPVTDDQFLVLADKITKKISASGIQAQIESSSMPPHMKEATAERLRITGVSDPQVDLVKRTVWFEANTTLDEVPGYTWYGVRVFPSGAAVSIAYSTNNDGSLEAAALFRQFHLSLRSLHTGPRSAP